MCCRWCSGFYSGVHEHGEASRALLERSTNQQLRVPRRLFVTAGPILVDLVGWCDGLEDSVALAFLLGSRPSDVVVMERWCLGSYLVSLLVHVGLQRHTGFSEQCRTTTSSRAPRPSPCVLGEGGGLYRGIFSGPDCPLIPSPPLSFVF